MKLEDLHSRRQSGRLSQGALAFHGQFNRLFNCAVGVFCRGACGMSSYFFCRFQHAIQGKTALVAHLDFARDGKILYNVPNRDFNGRLHSCFGIIDIIVRHIYGKL
ncbi:MAG: hypothetical protein OXE85_10290 [Roseovarius sp.]|nr:hypothetical protein [Roseovarius sp.]